MGLKVQLPSTSPQNVLSSRVLLFFSVDFRKRCMFFAGNMTCLDEEPKGQGFGVWFEKLCKSVVTWLLT